MIENNALQILSSFEIFKGLGEIDLKKIQAKCQRIEFKEAEMLMKEGQLEVCLPEQSGAIKYRRPTKVKLVIEHEGDFLEIFSH
jgi:hypothetical protein